ncbi:MAG: ABC transporter ATP-binding protein, partial [Xanthobacteraceae bacterium]|nr:ABC transporter ATP-binding protein [Xanthobacteraceae bacterium]
GEIVESGTVFDIFTEPLHPYTRGLLACVPSGSRAESRRLGTIPGLVPTIIGARHGCSFRNRCAFAIAPCAPGEGILLQTRAPGRDVRCIRSAELSATAQPTAANTDATAAEAENGDEGAVLVCRGVEKTFDVGGLIRTSQPIRAVDGVELDVHRGEVLAIVGESGSGKTTLGRMLLGLMQPSGGSILLDNKPLTALDPRDIARKVQPVFQDPFASLNPRKTIAQIIEFPLSVQGIGSRAERRDRVTEISQRVGLARRLLDSYPIQMSGGQRQRVAIARALVVQPDLVILDEPTSALDVSIQAQILNLLQDLRERLSLTYVFISHDMGVVRYLADRVAVMYRGRIVEMGPVERIFEAPQHDYTKSLLGAVLRADPRGRAANQSARAEDAIR